MNKNQIEKMLLKEWSYFIKLQEIRHQKKGRKEDKTLTRKRERKEEGRKKEKKKRKKITEETRQNKGKPEKKQNR